MMTSIALAVLAGMPAQPAGELKLTNVRLTVGELGPTRDNSKLIPGDILFIAYDIEGISIDGQGIARYTMTMEVVNEAGTRILPPPTEPKVEPREQTDLVPLRGNKMPGRAFIVVGLDHPAGNYTCKLSMTDTKTKATGSLNVKFEVTKREFAVTAVYTTYDGREISAPTSGQVGQTLYIHCSIASFERDMKTKQPDVEIEFQVYDEKNTAILATPIKQIQDAKSVPLVNDKDGAFSLRFPLFLNRPGKYTVEIKATDRVSKKTSSYKLPVTVTPAN